MHPRTMLRRAVAAGLLVVCGLAASGLAAWAQDAASWPNRPVKIIVNYTPTH